MSVSAGEKTLGKTHTVKQKNLQKSYRLKTMLKKRSDNIKAVQIRKIKNRNLKKQKSKRKIIAVDDEITLSVISDNSSEQGEAVVQKAETFSEHMSKVFEAVLAESEVKKSSQKFSKNQKKQGSIKVVKKMLPVKTAVEETMRKTRSFDAVINKRIMPRAKGPGADLNKPSGSVSKVSKASPLVAATKTGETYKKVKPSQVTQTTQTAVYVVSKKKISPKSNKGGVHSTVVSPKKKDTSKIDELYNHLLEQVKAATPPTKPPKHRAVVKNVLKPGKQKDTSPKTRLLKSSKSDTSETRISKDDLKDRNKIQKELGKKKIGSSVDEKHIQAGNRVKTGNGKTRKEKLRTKPVVGQKRKASEPVTIETDNESNSDDGILYSLSDMEESDTTPTKSPETSTGERTSSSSAVEKDLRAFAKVKKVIKPVKSHSEPAVEKSQKPKKIRLLDSLTKSGTAKPVRPVSPTPLFTSVKTAAVLPTAARRNNRAGGIPMYQYVMQPSAAIPVSPTSMSYKMLLENLPHQLHPKKAKNKSQDDGEEDIERRISVRSSECAFKYKEIIVKKCHKYTQIWLYTHTKMKNSLNPQVILELQSALNAAKYDDSNLVMLSGLGNVFCSGIDLHFLQSGDRKVVARQMVDALRDFTKTLITFPKLIVAVVTGPAIGLGMTMLPLCDVVYASDKATFFLPYAQLAQTPEGCSSYTLPQALGMAMANELLIGGRKITAIEACQLGLVSQVYWPTSMMQEVIPRVQNMAQSSGKVLETTKLLIRSHQRTKLDLTNESESNLLLELWSSSECQKAITEFLNDESNYTF